ncbi:hypothetical protein SAMN05216371_7056 [Streptomyces sp. TLI_053]|nr:hypothetical protein SAMN05216371_7056 [Streptomyces sp. TLI_053]
MVPSAFASVHRGRCTDGHRPCPKRKCPAWIDHAGSGPLATGLPGLSPEAPQARRTAVGPRSDRRSGIHRHTGGAEVMRGQLDHLVAMAKRPHIVLQVAPFSMVDPVPFSGFVTLLTFTDRTVAGCTGSADRRFVIRDSDTVTSWEGAYDRLQVEALSMAATLDLIHETRKELA